MFIVTAKLTKKRAAVIILGIILLIAAIIMLTTLVKPKNEETMADTAVQADISYKKIKDNESRIKFLNAFGWEVDENPVTIEEVVIPEMFGGSYEQYNELQKSQGLDLTKYQGKTVRRYTYRIINYENEDSAVYANLLIYKNRIIGGDICSAEYKGFMHGFAGQ